MPADPAETAELTCPHCGHVQAVSLPTDACLYFRDCAGCNALIKPRYGDCCVVCSYGDRLCPPARGSAE